MDFPPRDGGERPCPPPVSRWSGGEFPPRFLKGRGGNLGCPPPTLREGNLGGLPPVTGGEKILAFFSCPPPFFDPFYPRHGGGLGHFRVPPRLPSKIPPSWRRGGTNLRLCPPPSPEVTGGEHFVPPRFPRGRGGNAKNAPPPWTGGGEIHLWSVQT